MTELRFRKHVKGRRGKEFCQKIKGLKVGEIIGVAIRCIQELLPGNNI